MTRTKTKTKRTKTISLAGLTLALAGCCIQIQRSALEGGPGDQTTPITGAETWVDLQADVDADGLAAPLSELGSGD